MQNVAGFVTMDLSARGRRACSLLERSVSTCSSVMLLMRALRIVANARSRSIRAADRQLGGREPRHDDSL